MKICVDQFSSLRILVRMALTEMRVDASPSVLVVRDHFPKTSLCSRSHRVSGLIFIKDNSMVSKIFSNDDLINEECSRYKEDLMIQNAISVLERRMFKGGEKLSHPKDVENFLRLQLAGQTREVLSCIFLDSTHQVLAYEPLFYGTIDSTSVHPRVILQRALEHHCAAVIMAHNHPSGDINPSGSDQKLTKLVRDLLLKIDVRLLDHFIIGKGEPYSFATAGCI